MENQSGRAQMRRESENPPSDVHSQAHSFNFLEETGNSVSNMVQGAADVGKGATQGALSLARGVAFGAANIAQGASDVVKNTIGSNNSNNNMTTTRGSGGSGSLTQNLNNTNHHHHDVEGLNYHTMGDSTHPSNPNDPAYPGNPNTRI